jgi:hypothetical protein
MEILLGDHYWKVVKDNPIICISTSAVLVPTMFGWILSRNRSGTHVSSAAVNFVILDQTFTLSDDDLRRFWELEAIGISTNDDRSLRAKDKIFLEEFRASFRVEDQHRVVSVPKKQDTTLPSNKLHAEKRLNLTKTVACGTPNPLGVLRLLCYAQFVTCTIFHVNLTVFYEHDYT